MVIIISNGMSTGLGIAAAGIRGSTRGGGRREARRLRKPIGGGRAGARQAQGLYEAEKISMHDGGSGTALSYYT